MTTERILIIDPQEELHDFYTTWLEPIGLELRLMTAGREVLSLLDHEPFDLALLDLSLPDMDSLELLATLKEIRPNMPVIIGFDPANVAVGQITTALNHRVEVFVEKPYDSEALLSAIWRIQEQSPTGAIYGNLRDISLPNIVSLMCNEGKIACMEINHRGQTASVFFEKGQVVHASLNDLVGETAFFEVLAWEAGNFTITFGQYAPEQTIESSWSGLLLDGMNRLDEASFDQEQLEEVPPPVNPDAAFWSEPVEPLPVARNDSIELDVETQMQVKDRLDQLHQILNGRCTLLVNRNGRLFHAQGQVNEGQSLALAALVASSFSANGEVAKMLATEKETEADFHHSLQEGNLFNLYSAQINPNWLVAVAFEPEATNLGLARQMTLQAAGDLLTLLQQPSSANGQAADGFGGIDDVFEQTVSDNIEDLFAQVLED